MRNKPSLLLLLLLCVSLGALSAPRFAMAQAQTCPDLSTFYTDAEPDWPRMRSALAEIFSRCLRSSEFFALYGAAQLYSGQLPEAIESLERSLLLDPDNGAALVDYGEALYRDGELFTAIEINDLLLEREDIPPTLVGQIESRQSRWQSLTRQTSWQLDILGGYDDNLNGASDQDSITLTLSGEPVILSLSEEFRVVSGPLLNARIQGTHHRLSVDSQETFSGEVRTRVSEDSNSNLAQVSGRYSISREIRPGSWQLSTGINHLYFSSTPLFTALDAELRFRQPRSGTCQPHYGLALQHQTWHNQSRLNGIEAKLGLGSTCTLPQRPNQRLNVELNLLHNSELKPDRLGGSRDGWQVSVDWQVALSRGVMLAQLSHTRIEDQRGYSPLLANNAQRQIGRSAFLLQYRENLPALGRRAQFIINLFHQNQNSTLNLFQTDDSTAEIGLSWRF